MAAGTVGVIGNLYDLLSSHQQLVLLVFFVGVFVASGIAVRFHRNEYVRTGYLSMFFAVLLVVNLTTLTLFPFMHWYKFSEPRPAEETSHLIKVVDADGEELLLDARSTPPAIGSSYYALGHRMDEVYSPDERAEVARYLLSKACQYREQLTRTRISPASWTEFPRHTLDYQWSRQQVSNYSEFTAIRVYEVTIRTSDDGRRVTAYTEKATGTYDPGNCSTLDTMAGASG